VTARPAEDAGAVMSTMQATAYRQRVGCCGWAALPGGPVGRRCDSERVTAWQDVEQAEPEFAQRVRGLFDAHRHKTIATVRADGSPRISGIEAAFEDGELTFGSMPNARKGADLRRDPRFALHSATVDPVAGAEAQWPGEAKISGRAMYAGPAVDGADADLFRADIVDVVHTHLNEGATLLVVEWWTPTHGLRRVERE
jgi:Pyridoxamine 5'-phosphate oxidase